ncbi:NAD-dependent epimerase/dehydratase family protein [Shewanella glacialipiscicola]|uniref:NAD-dependent epimerase/dehydratase family protein n=1 Tax=Shewanella glacialipiscicola TaxID=614069 RepID=UPI003D797B3D
MILLTGTSGYIGHHLKEHLSAKGFSFRYVVRTVVPVTYSCSNIFPISQLDGKTNWKGAFDNVKTVIHLAGIAHVKDVSASDYLNVNTHGAFHLANEAAKAGVKRFVYVSSIGVNGTATLNNSFSAFDKANPQNAYSKSKYDAEVGLTKIAADTGLELVIVRPTLVYGANAPGNFGMLTKLVNKLSFFPFGLTDNKRDFIAVQNLADLLITCANHPSAAGHTFLASDGETVSINEFTNAIAKGLNKKLIQLAVPVSLMRLVARLAGKSVMAEQLLGNLQVDSSNAHEVLGWTPPYTMEQAMALLLENKK